MGEAAELLQLLLIRTDLLEFLLLVSRRLLDQVFQLSLLARKFDTLRLGRGLGRSREEEASSWGPILVYVSVFRPALRAGGVLCGLSAPTSLLHPLHPGTQCFVERSRARAPCCSLRSIAGPVKVTVLALAPGPLRSWLPLQCFHRMEHLLLAFTLVTAVYFALTAPAP